MENESIYFVEYNEENINILKEKGFSLYYNRETGELEGCELKLSNPLYMYNKIDFKFDKISLNFILNKFIASPTEDVNLKLVKILLDLQFNNILKKQEQITEENNENTNENTNETGDENAEIL